MAAMDLVASTAQEEEEQSRQQTVSRFLAGHDLHVLRRRRVWRPPTDVYETDSHVVIKVEIAGMNEEDFDVSAVGRRLIISGHRRDPVGKLVYQNMEIRYGEFRTEVRVDWVLDRSAIDATYGDGFLFVELPKAEKHRVPVRVYRAEES